MRYRNAVLFADSIRKNTTVNRIIGVIVIKLCVTENLRFIYNGLKHFPHLALLSFLLFVPTGDIL